MTAKQEAKTSSGGAKRSPAPPVLFGPAGSMNLYICELRTAGGDAGLPITFEATFHIRLNAGSIDGSPAVAGGCVLEVSDAYIDQLRSIAEPKHGRPSLPFRRIVQAAPEVLLEPIEEARERFVSTIKLMGPYGQKYAFLDDTPNADRLITQMRAQAGKEAAVQQEAQVVLAQHAGLNTVDPSLSDVMAAERRAAARSKAGAM